MEAEIDDLKRENEGLKNLIKLLKIIYVSGEVPETIKKMKQLEGWLIDERIKNGLSRKDAIDQLIIENKLLNWNGTAWSTIFYDKNKETKL
jgi:hypothetical protein